MDFHYESIDHVQLSAPYGSEETARNFYKDLLGFQEIEKPEQLKKNGGVWFRAGNVDIHIGLESNFKPMKKAHPAIRVKDIEKMKVFLDKYDITYLEDDKLPGANRFYLMDPFCNRLEFLEWDNL